MTYKMVYRIEDMSSDVNFYNQHTWGELIAFTQRRKNIEALEGYNPFSHTKFEFEILGQKNVIFEIQKLKDSFSSIILSHMNSQNPIRTGEVRLLPTKGANLPVISYWLNSIKVLRTSSNSNIESFDVLVETVSTYDKDMDNYNKGLLGLVITNKNP